MGETIAFIFGLVGLGYLAAWTGLLSKVAGDALTQFATVIAVPALLFKTLSTLDLTDLSPWPLWLAYFSAIPPVWLAGHMITTRLFKREPAVGVVACRCAGPLRASRRR
jgi:predicted permease